VSIKKEDVFVAGLITGLTQEAQKCFFYAMGGKNNPSFKAIFDDRSNQTAILVLNANSNADKSKITFEDVKDLVLSDSKQMIIPMMQQSGKWCKANRDFPSAAYLWEIELTEI